MNNKSSCIFKLRNDGLGNRLEEIMKLDLGSADQSILVWPAQSNGRGNSYAGLSQWLSFSRENVRIVEESDPLARSQKSPVCQRLNQTDDQHLSENCRRIGPKNFQVAFADTRAKPFAPVGVHIRKTDRIKPVNRDVGEINDYTSPEESTQSVEYAFQALSMLRPPSRVFVASDDPKEAARFKARLQEAGVSIVEPNITNAHPLQERIPPFFVDFFALTLCREVWMVSSFSSFAVMAARVGESDVPLYSLLLPNATNLARYHVPEIRPFPIAFSWWPNNNNNNNSSHPGSADAPVLHSKGIVDACDSSFMMSSPTWVIMPALVWAVLIYLARNKRHRIAVTKNSMFKK